MSNPAPKSFHTRGVKPSADGTASARQLVSRHKTIYRSLAAEIRSSIQAGKLQPGEFIGSEHELARRQSISRVTVRRASELLMTEGLIERRPGKGLYVQSAIPAARQGGVVQVVLGNLAWESQLRMARGVQQAAEADQSVVQLYDAHGDPQRDLRVIEQLPQSGAKGAIIVSLHSPAFMKSIYMLHETGFPFVLLDHRMRDLTVPAVVADNHDGGYQVGRMLAEMGHSSVAFIGDLAASTVQDRLEGLRDGLSDAGVPFRTSMIADLRSGFEPFADCSACIADAVNHLMSQSPRPTAIYCSCDAIARSVYRQLGGMGLHVPDDISVVGNDDDPALQWLSPGLTTVQQSFVAMGREAMDLLRHRIADSSGPCEVRVHPVKLIRRESVAAR